MEMGIGIDRIGGATTCTGNTVRDAGALTSGGTGGRGILSQQGLTVTESPVMTGAGEVGNVPEPSRTDELTTILSCYNYPPPPMPEGLNG